jgi:hypothetical protein
LGENRPPSRPGLTIAQSISATIFGRDESGAGAYIRRGCAQRDAMTSDPGFVAPAQPVAPRRPNTKRARSRSINASVTLATLQSNVADLVTRTATPWNKKEAPGTLLPGGFSFEGRTQTNRPPHSWRLPNRTHARRGVDSDSPARRRTVERPSAPIPPPGIGLGLAVADLPKRPPLSRGGFQIAFCCVQLGRRSPTFRSPCRRDDISSENHRASAQRSRRFRAQ